MGKEKFIGPFKDFDQIPVDMKCVSRYLAFRSGREQFVDIESDCLNACDQ
jgi:hypothetical protein